MARVASRVSKLASGGTAFDAHPFLGVDLRADPKYIRPGTLLTEQNFVPYQTGIAAKRKGTAFLNATAWANINRVRFGLRYYVNSSTRYKLACLNRDAGDQIARVNDASGEITVLTGMPSVGANTLWRGAVLGESPAAYFGNGNAGDGILTTSNGTSIAALTGTQIPTEGHVGGPYFDRMLCWYQKRLLYSRANNFTNWSNPDTGNSMYIFVQHPEDITAAFQPGPDRSDVAYRRLYICTPTSTFIHLQDFDQGQGTPVATFGNIHETCGIASFNTLAWTDRGAIGMGVDNVWLFPFAGPPIPIGYEIQSAIRAIPAAYRSRCCATYWNGFYILSYVRAGQTSPDREYWADLRQFVESSIYSPVVNNGITWHGPMIRSSFGLGCFMVQSQNPDENELFAFGAAEGRCMQLETDIYTDGGAQMVSVLETSDLGLAVGSKTVEGYIVGTYITDTDSIQVEASVDEGRSVATQTVTLTASGARFDTAVFGTDTWGGAFYDINEGHFDDRPEGNKVRLKLTHTLPQAIAIKELSAVMHLFGRI